MALASDSSVNLTLAPDEETMSAELLHRGAVALAHDASSYLEALAGPLGSLLADPGLSESLRRDVETLRQGLSGALVLVDRVADPLADDPTGAGTVSASFRRMQRRFESLLTSDVVLEAIGLEAVPKVAVPQEELDRLIHNLLLNATEALPEGGRIVVYASELSGIPAFGRRPAVATPCVKISVTDDGRGIDFADVIAALWVCTSRSSDVPVRGLSIAYSIAHAAGGELDIRGGEGEGEVGTQVHCYLPVARREP